MVSIRTSLTATAGAALVGLGTVGSAQAAIFTLNTSDSRFTPGVDNQGAWSNTVRNQDTNDSYFVGRTARGGEFRNFFSFNLAPVKQQLESGNQPIAVLAVTLVLSRYQGLGNPTQTITLFDVSTRAANLNRNVGTSTPIFNDLGSGDSYGSFSGISTTRRNPPELSFSLNSFARADVASAIFNGGFFSIGGRLNLTSPGQQGLFLGSSDIGVQRLVIDAETVPEPSSVMGVLGFGAFGAGWILKRRQKNQKKASSA